jgi:hypothetical protein
LQEPAPVDFGLGEGDGGAEDDAAAIDLADADGNEHGATADGAPDPHFFIMGVHEKVSHGIKGPDAPLLEEGIQLGGDTADFGGGNGGAAEFFQDGRDAAGGHALQIHLPAEGEKSGWLSPWGRFGDGQSQGFFAALAFVEGLGVEGGGSVADLGDGKLHGAAAGEEGFGFEAVGEAEALVGALVGGGLKVLGALDFHGGVDEQANGAGQAFEPVGEEMIEHGVGLGMGEVWFGHGDVGLSRRRISLHPALPGRTRHPATSGIGGRGGGRRPGFFAIIPTSLRSVRVIAKNPP